MVQENAAPAVRGVGDWDRVAAELQTLRLRAGEPSYGEIARRISELRVDRGASQHAARLARTTVYDAFRTGRARLNLELVREIVEVLGGEARLVDDWLAPPVAAPVPGREAVDEVDSVDSVDSVDETDRPRLRPVVLLLLGCVAVNVVGRVLVDFLDLPIYLDMVGTAVAAVSLGPWWGASVGVATNLLGVASSGTASLGFAVVNVVGALLWGYGVRRFGLGRTLARYLALNVLVALVCTVVAVPILVLAYGGSTGHGQDMISGTLLALTHTMIVAIGLSNLLVSIADKLISGFVALVVISSLPAAARSAAPAPAVVQPPVLAPER